MPVTPPTSSFPGSTRGPRRLRLAALAAALRGRCPRCRRGRLFRGPLDLASACTECGLHYDDDGSAVTVGMVFGFFVPLMAALPLGFVLIRGDAPTAMAFGAPAAIIVGAAPIVVRLSKVVWVWALDGHGILAAGDPPG
ncbi:MAG: hypothetical protein ABI780_10555 [Ardenticatenales bacterium]